MNFIEMLRRLKTEFVVGGFEWSCQPHPNPEVNLLVMCLNNKEQSVRFLVDTEISDENLEVLCESTMTVLLEHQFTGCINLLLALGQDPRVYVHNYIEQLKARSTAPATEN